MPLIVVTTSPRVAPGLLSHRAWQVLSEGPVRTAVPDHPHLPYLAEAGVAVEVVTPDPAALVRQAQTGTVVWLEADEALMRAIGHAAVALEEPPVIEVVPGSYDLPGARLLDLVAVMDRLRTSCPWDAEQTHESLAPYLIEEAYEVLETIEEGDHGALREELGDLLLQVAFHARVAQDRAGEPGGGAFDIDDVAAGIVDKLVRRHPHVFAAVRVDGAEEVSDNWETIKAAERAAKNGGDAGSVVDGVPMGQPALSLAAQLLRRAERAGVTAEPPAEGLGGRLFELVRQAHAEGLDPEAELRAAARAYRDRVRARESDAARGNAGA
ncbi:nucleoside triphosphate pyrophosphohydrolase [Planobispora rosea]|uniref:Nucleoside triphosphate pyrophosphohydrolase n=1 Tax=Planobispora rosea TaxID=35762 RepID=A0A8J3S6P6_PLARO|nr:MazG family protein [Planobispora rosea]GGS90444.1 nucleoside triphosphate pyrophosphohydrolase [Planobispora rosea]GIH86976.1 nucleoside triphosphate pyrophosphohydrolase [Planobispora rosea]